MTLIGKKPAYLRMTSLVEINIDTASVPDLLKQIEVFVRRDLAVRDFVKFSEHQDPQVTRDDQKLRKLTWDCAALVSSLTEEVTPPGSYYSIPERYQMNFWSSDAETLITYIGLLCQQAPNVRTYVLQELAYYKRQYPLSVFQRLMRTKYQLKHLSWTQLINLAVSSCQLTASYKGNPL